MTKDKLLRVMKTIVENADTVKDDWYTSEKEAYIVIFDTLCSALDIRSEFYGKIEGSNES